MDSALKAIERMAYRYNAKMRWVSDYDRLQRMEDWRDEHEAFEDPGTAIVECDCEDLMQSGTRWVFENGVLVPEHHGFSLVCTQWGRQQGKLFDHARAWYLINGEYWYQDCASMRPFYRHGSGPFYHAVQHSFYNDPQRWFVTE